MPEFQTDPLPRFGAELPHHGHRQGILNDGDCRRSVPARLPQAPARRGSPHSAPWPEPLDARSEPQPRKSAAPLRKPLNPDSRNRLSTPIRRASARSPDYEVVRVGQYHQSMVLRMLLEQWLSILDWIGSARLPSLLAREGMRHKLCAHYPDGSNAMTRAFSFKDSLSAAT